MAKAKEEKLVEVCRSFSYKMGLPKFENRDFFCSQKAEVPESEAVATSEALYEFCKSEVIKSVNKYKLENLPKEEVFNNEKTDKDWKKFNEKIDEEKNKDFSKELKSNSNWQRAAKKSQDDQEKAEDLGREL